MLNADLLKPSFGNHMWENSVFYVLLLVGSVLMIGPIVWMAPTALKLPADQFDHCLIPREVTLSNFTSGDKLR